MNDGDTVRYLTEIRQVREVGLTGVADLEYWRAILARERLVPYDHNGYALVMVNAVELRWLGIRFRELVMTVRAHEADGGNRANGFFLVEAYNTNALLALSEQIFFATPYVHGDIDISLDDPVYIRHSHRRHVCFNAQRAGSGAPVGFDDSALDAVIYLANGQRYYARLGGRAERHPFSDGHDTLAITPTGMQTGYQYLLESQFRPVEWHMRYNGVHSRTKTYHRVD